LFDAAITENRIRVYVSHSSVYVSSHGPSLLADIFSVLLLFFYLIFLLFGFISFFHPIELSPSDITWQGPGRSGARMRAIWVIFSQVSNFFLSSSLCTVTKRKERKRKERFI